MFRRVSVWLDDLAPDRGSYAHASEWAARLRVPLRAVAAPLKMQGGRPLAPAADTCSTATRVDVGPFEAPPAGASRDALRAGDAMCSRGRGALPPSVEERPSFQGMEEFFRPSELCVFGRGLPRALKETFLRQSLRSSGAAALICPETWQPISRVLVLNEHRDSDSYFLECVVEVCRALEITPVVLTVARSEREAGLKQRFAEATFAFLRQGADFDLAVGCDVRTAVACGARLRGCSHVFVESRNVPRWWRWLRGDVIQHLSGLSNSLTFLTIPGTSASCPSAEQRSRGGGQALGSATTAAVRRCPPFPGHRSSKTPATSGETGLARQSEV